MNGNRWQVGDVLVWFETAELAGARTDSDVLLNFYDEEGELICWAEAFERDDLAGFEEGDLNCGFLGNLEKQAWLKRLLDHGVSLGVRAREHEGENSDWYVERITLDFRLGPNPTTPTVRHWDIEEWIKPGLGEQRYDCNRFQDVGFDKELEMRSGDSSDLKS